MKLALKLITAGLVHILFFACYPETGRLGNYYLAVSTLLWAVFITFINTSSALVRFISGAAGFVINAAAFALMAAAIAVTMPQQDKVSVLEKVQDERYPDMATVRRGLARFGVRLDMEKARKEVRDRVKQLDGKSAEALHELKDGK